MGQLHSAIDSPKGKLQQSTNFALKNGSSKHMEIVCADHCDDNSITKRKSISTTNKSSETLDSYNTYSSKSSKSMFLFPKTPESNKSRSSDGNDGISLTGLKDFINSQGSHLKNLTAHEVYSLIVHPITYHKGISFCEHLKSRGKRYIKPANIYISHAWDSNFFEVCNAILKHFENESDSENVVVWINLFSNNHSKGSFSDDTDEYNLQYFKNLQDFIRRIGHTLLVIPSLSDPIPLRRSFCLFELFCTLSMQLQLDVAILPENSFGMIKSNLVHSFGAALISVNINDSVASIDNEKKFILSIINDDDKGIEKFNFKLFVFLQNWTINTLKAAIDQESSKVKLFDLKCKLADFYTTQCNYRKAEMLYDQCYQFYGSWDNNHSEKLFVSGCLAFVSEKQGNVKAAKHLYKECVSGYSAYYGRSHIFTLRALNRLACFNSNIKNHKMAVALFDEVYIGTQRLYGPKDMKTVIALYRLGCEYIKVCAFDEALSILQKCYAAFGALLGPDHVTTIKCMVVKASVCNRLTETHRSNSLIVDSYTLCRATLKFRAVTCDTAKAILGIAKSYRQQGFDSYADDLELTCYNQCLAVYGPDHPFMKLCEENF